MTLKHLILSELSKTSGLLKKQSTLLADVNITGEEPATSTELANELKQLESLNMVIPNRDPLTRELSWKLTAEGEAYVSEKIRS